MSLSKDKYIQEIFSLKKERDAIILAHNYQLPEIQDVADFIGDSLALSRKAEKANAKTIIFVVSTLWLKRRLLFVQIKMS